MNNLKKLRESKGLTTKSLAERTDLSAATLSRLETGKRDMGIKYALCLAKFFGVSVEYLIGSSCELEKEDKTAKFKPGQVVIYQCGSKFELGVIKSKAPCDYYFVNFHTGDTAAKVSATYLHSISNDYAFDITRLKPYEKFKPSEILKIIAKYLYADDWDEVPSWAQNKDDVIPHPLGLIKMANISDLDHEEDHRKMLDYLLSYDVKNESEEEE